MHSLQKNGYRVGHYKSFVEPVLHDLNVTVQPYSLVTKVVLNKNNEATGVAVKYFGLLELPGSMNLWLTV